MRLRRSATDVFALNEENVCQIAEGPTDCMMFDLEDGIPLTMKAEARKQTVKLFSSTDFHGKERVIRINSVDTEHYRKDMDEVVAVAVPDSIRLPKCETPKNVLIVDRDLAEIEERLGMDRNSIEIWAMVESPLGIRNAYEIGRSYGNLCAG